MTDAELRAAERAYAGEKSPENLAILLKNTKRAGDDWEGLFQEEVGESYMAMCGRKSFCELHQCLQDFIRDETDVYMLLNSEDKRNKVIEVLKEFRFPRVRAHSMTRRGLDRVLKYRNVIREMVVETADSTGDPFMERLCESNLPIVELELSNSKVTDNGVELLASSPLPLKRLNLSWTIVTAKSLEYLARSSLPLEELDVRNTGVDWIAIEDYKQVKTDVEVQYDSGPRRGGWRTLT